MQEYIFSLVTTIVSWPIAAIVIVLILKKPIAGILGRISVIKHNSIEIQLSKTITELDKQAELLNIKITKNESNRLFMERVHSIAEISPVSVIVFAYYQIEYTFTEEYKLPGDEFIRKIMKDFPLDFYKRELIEEYEYHLFLEIERIYNSVMNNNDLATGLNKETAIKYGRTAGILIDRVNEIKANLN
jgi:hypothetical protein